MAPVCSQLAAVSLLLLAIVASSSSIQYFSVEPQDTETVQGNRVVFSCRVINRPAGAQLYWQIPALPDRFVGPEYQIPADYADRFEITGQTALNEYNLAVKSASEDDEGVYRCILFQAPRGDASISPTQVATSRDAQLTVATLDSSGLPDCWATPQRAVHAGDSVRLSCASLDAGLDLRWTRNSTVIPASSSGSSSIPTLITVNFTADTTMNGDRFTCSSPTVSNMQCDVVLSVFSPPSVMIEPLGEIKVGNEGRYRCTATGNPNVFSYSWRYNNRPVEYRYDRRFNMAFTEENGAVLVLPDVQTDDDAALLECTAINDNGEASTTYAVRVANNNITSIVAWCMCAVVVAIILILLVVFFYWRSQQHRKLERLSEARKSNKRRDLDAETNGHVNPAFTSFSPLEVDSVGYGPDVQPYQSKPSDREYDHGGPKPIPRQSSTAKSGGSDSDADFISKDVENDDAEMTQTYTYQVNPNFKDYRNKASYDVSAVVDDDDNFDGNDLKKPPLQNDLDLEKELVGELSMFSSSSDYDRNFDRDAEPVIVSTEL